MSKLKFSPDLFLETAELNRFQKFIDEDGFRNFLIQHTDSFGLIRKENAAFTNALVQEDIGLKVKINAIEAIDADGNYIYNKATEQLSIPADSNWYWIFIEYNASNLEQGTFSIDSSGNLVCTSGDGALLSILRGQPNYPSRISFPNAVNNTLEYDVLEVLDDNNAVLQGSFTNETDLTLAVVGTFTAGHVPLTSEKYIFQYDSCTVTLVASNTLLPPAHTSGYVFPIARVKNDGASLKIEDKRSEIWTVDSNYFIHNLDKTANPLVGVEQITYDDPLSTKVKNIVQLAWAFAATSFSVNLKLNMITITAGHGGLFKATNFNTVFTNGDFDGWRLYVQTGEYFKIKTSTLNGSTIELIMDSLDSAEFFSDADSTVAISQQLLVTPDAEEIEFICTPDPAATNGIVTQKITFPINKENGRIPLNVYAASNASYNIKYRYKHLRDYSAELLLPDDAVGFYNESQFDENGVIIGSPTQSPYIAHATNGFIPLQLHPDAYSIFQDRVDLGDKLGVRKTLLSNSSPLVELTVGTDYQYQYFSDGDDSVSNDALTLAADAFISLKKLNASGVTCRNGNYFLLHFKQKIVLNGFTLRIVTDYVDPVTYTELKAFTSTDEAFLASSEEGIYVRATFDGTDWFVNSTNESLVALLESDWESFQITTVTQAAGGGFDPAPGATLSSVNAASIFRYKKIGKTLLFQLRYYFTITGAGATEINVNLASIFTANNIFSALAVDAGLNGLLINASVDSGTGVLKMKQNPAANFGAGTYDLLVNGSINIA